MKQYSKNIYFPKILDYQYNLLGVILLSTGIFFLYLPSLFDIKISATLILTGLVIILFINRTHTQDSENETQLTTIHSTLFTYIILLILITYVITIDLEFDIFIILFFIEIMILKELLNKNLSLFLQKRLNIFISILFVLFMILIVKRIINISTM